MCESIKPVYDFNAAIRASRALIASSDDVDFEGATVPIEVGRTIDGAPPTLVVWVVVAGILLLLLLV
jgi:hypothetical protein